MTATLEAPATTQPFSDEVMALIPEGSHLGGNGRSLILPVNGSSDRYAVFTAFASLAERGELDHLRSGIAARRRWGGYPLANFDPSATPISPTSAPAEPAFTVGQVLNPRDLSEPEPPVGTVVRGAARERAGLDDIYHRADDGTWRFNSPTGSLVVAYREWSPSLTYTIESLPETVASESTVEPTSDAPLFTVGQVLNPHGDPEPPVGSQLGYEGGDRADFERRADGVWFEVRYPERLRRWGAGAWADRAAYTVVRVGPEAEAAVEPAPATTPITPGSRPQPPVGSVMLQTRRDGAVIRWTHSDGDTWGDAWVSDGDPFSGGSRTPVRYQWFGGWDHLTGSTFALLSEGASTEASTETPATDDGVPAAKLHEIATRYARVNLGRESIEAIENQLLDMGVVELKYAPAAGVTIPDAGLRRISGLPREQVETLLATGFLTAELAPVEGKVVPRAEVLRIARQMQEEHSWCGTTDTALREIGALDALPTKAKVVVQVTYELEVEAGRALDSYALNNISTGTCVTLGDDHLPKIDSCFASSRIVTASQVVQSAEVIRPE